MKTIIGSITFTLFLISCSKTSEEKIYSYFQEQNLPMDATFFVANGLGCYAINEQLIDYYQANLDEQAKYFLILRDLDYFKPADVKKIAAIKQVRVDTSGILPKLNLGTFAPSIIQFYGKDSTHIIGLTVQNIDSVLGLYP